MPLSVNCPLCQKKLQIPDQFLGRMVKCPSCKEAFQASDPGSGPAMQDSGRESGAGHSKPERTGSPRPTDGDEAGDDRDDQPIVRRRRRRRRRSEGSAAMAPAVALLCVAMLSLLFAFGYGVLQIIAAKNMPPPPPGMDEARKAGYEIGLRVGLYGFPIAFILWALLVLAGSIQMMRLKTYGLAVTGAIVAFLPCNPGCLLGLPFGIWALIILAKPEVKEAFD